MRSLATRDAGSEISAALPDAIAACRVAGFDLVVVETSGIGQGDAAIVPLVDVSLYVMTPEFGAASQLEKIDMLDFADFVAINKFDRKGAADALRDVRKQYQRNRELFTRLDRRDAGLRHHRRALQRRRRHRALPGASRRKLAEQGLKLQPGRLPAVATRQSTNQTVVVPPQRARYLAEIAETVRGYQQARERAGAHRARAPAAADTRSHARDSECKEDDANARLRSRSDRDAKLDARAKKLLDMWPQMQQAYSGDEYVVKIRDKEIRTKLTYTSLSGTQVRKVALPRYEDHGELLKWLMLENVPGSFPFTAGVFAFKRENEDPTRMFAGEGDPFRTNRRFHHLSEGMPAKRLSTAFDSVTLYGFDPD